MIKIIFFDIDGVFNCQDYYDKLINTGLKTIEDHADDYGMLLDPLAIERLRTLIDSCGGNDIVKLVCSSAWRHGAGPKKGNNKKRLVGYEYINAMWKFRKYPGEVIDITPYYNVEEGKNKQIYSKQSNIGVSSIPRGYEIQQWLEANGFIHWHYYDDYVQKRIDECQIETYVIIDDDSDMLLSQQMHFVHTDNMHGFNDDALRRAIRILNRPVLYQSFWRKDDDF